MCVIQNNTSPDTESVIWKLVQVSITYLESYLFFLAKMYLLCFFDFP